MRYHYEKPEIYLSLYGKTYYCDHYIYDSCTLFEINDKGLAIIQQRYDKDTKKTWWSELDPWLTDEIYTNKGFKSYFDEHSDYPKDKLYPTVTVRQIMWALKMKPLKRELWETYFDRNYI